MAGNDSGRDSIAQMIAYLMREAGVLILVFEVFHSMWDKKTPEGAYHLWINAVIAAIFMVSGIAVERRRSE